MKFRTISFLFIIANVSYSATESASGWRSDPQHPQLQYRVRCFREAATVDWRNGYPGQVRFRASIKSPSYDGPEDVRIAPGASEQTKLETMECSPNSFRVALTRFSMAAPPTPPPPPPPPAAAAAAASNPPLVPSLLPFEPETEKLSELTVEALAGINVGMKQQQVVQKLGPPSSKLTLPEEGELIETYRYRIVNSKITIVRFSNGTVTDIAPPQ
jgi:hypothetical protein